MPTLDELQRQFEQRLDAIASRRLGGTAAQQGIDAADTIVQRLAAYEARVQAQIDVHRQQADAPLAGVGAQPGQPPPRVVLSGDPTLRSLDTLMTREFDFSRYLPGLLLTSLPTVYCTTLHEFFAPQAEAMDVSEAARQGFIAAAAREAEEQAQKGAGTLGFFIPGRGCFLNGWLFGQSAGGDSVAALKDPAITTSIMATAVHEKMGHGFVSEGTTLGREKKRLGAWRFDLARRFARRPADTPESALAAEKWGILFGSSQLLEEGWATWIEHHLLGLMTTGKGKPWPPSRYTLTELWPPLSALLKEAATQEDKDAAIRVGQALETLFTSENPTPDELHSAVLVLDHCPEAIDDAIGQTVGQPLAYVAGYLLLRDLEARLGAFCLPYAAAIAANVSYDIDRISSSDLQRVITRSARLNVDSRLAHLRLLTLECKGDVAELARLAHEGLSLALPEELRV